MSVIDAINNATPPESGVSQDNPPPAGSTVILLIADAKYDTYTNETNLQETYGVVEYRTEDGQYTWSDFRGLTKDGVIQPKRVDAFKGLLRSLGLPGPFPNDEALKAQLKGIVGRRYSADIKATSSVNRTTGAFYVNTYINGPAGAPVQTAPPVAQPMAPVPAPIQQHLQRTAGAPAVPAPGAQFGDSIPWDQPAQQWSVG